MNGTVSSVTRVSVISTGTVDIRPQHLRSDGTPPLWWLMTSRRWTGPRPINAYVIEHAQGLVLFDTGQDRASLTDPGYLPRGLAGVLNRRLARFDIPELTHASIVTSHAELQALDRPFAQLNGLMREHIMIGGLRWQLVTPQPADDPFLAPFTAAHDLFGDGSLILLPTPGHTPGSLSLLVRRPGSPSLLMVGDLTFDVDLMEHEQVPGIGQPRQLRDSTRKVNMLRARDQDLVVLAAHDHGAAASLAAAEQAKPGNQAHQSA